jgi:AraC family transcriptional regulator
MHQVSALSSVLPTSISSASMLSKLSEIRLGTAAGIPVEGSQCAENEVDHGGALSLTGLRSVVEELCRALTSSLHDERASAEASLQRANTILGFSPPNAIHAGALGGRAVEIPIEPVRGGLAPWRIRRVTIHIEKNLGTAVRTKDLAALVELSTFHFCRAFRDSLGDSPHAYVTRRRIERAQNFMLTTNTSLSQIAMDCGLADQSHFNRLFRQFVGESPGAWRRARATALQSADAPKHVQSARLS